jgi:hypothetical protein
MKISEEKLKSVDIEIISAIKHTAYTYIRKQVGDKVYGQTWNGIINPVGTQVIDRILFQVINSLRFENIITQKRF